MILLDVLSRIIDVWKCESGHTCDELAARLCVGVVMLGCVLIGAASRVNIGHR